ncbi:hypothetical protein Salat_1938300 [Sesamum alatum]|uniref:DRBM domain-containing protein n=1 Tax=Sesamum alatum TaxID=300844 RepID=A0AAE1Y4S5_9LAMI|nr:hypothetical protein Salat_1938300 [Sesamum alatum]
MAELAMGHAKTTRLWEGISVKTTALREGWRSWQWRSWELPEYTIVNDGPDHMPFTATIKVHGEVFQTPVQCRSAKGAEDTAARIAFDHFNLPSSPASTVKIGRDTFQGAEASTKKLAEISAARVAYDVFTRVKLGRDTFQGVEASTKKMAEISAARVAYDVLTRGKKLVAMSFYPI